MGGSFTVTAENYAAQLAANGVILSADDRRKRILDGIAALVAGKGLSVKTDEALLETLVFITEYPTPILGSFDAGYLSLPEEVIFSGQNIYRTSFQESHWGGSTLLFLRCPYCYWYGRL